MMVSANRPYFAPYTGFFAKALRSDVMVILDTVQFPRGTTWITRNRFKNEQGTLWLTVPVWKKGLGLQRIHEVRICHERPWAQKHLKSLKTAYGKAPFFEDHLPFLEDLFGREFDKLVPFNRCIIDYLLTCLNIPTPLVFLSDLAIEAKEPALSLEICKRLEATHFLVQSSAKKFIHDRAFQEAGILWTQGPGDPGLINS